MAIRTVGVLGCGLMGAGIAQVSAASGYRTIVREVNQGLLDKGLGRIRKFLDAMPLGFPVLLDRDAKVARAWQAKMLPATYVVGPDGVIRFQHRGELDWSKPEVRRQIAGLMK